MIFGFIYNSICALSQFINLCVFFHCNRMQGPDTADKFYFAMRVMEEDGVAATSERIAATHNQPSKQAVSSKTRFSTRSAACVSTSGWAVCRGALLLLVVWHSSLASLKSWKISFAPIISYQFPLTFFSFPLSIVSFPFPYLFFIYSIKKSSKLRDCPCAPPEVKTAGCW